MSTEQSFFNSVVSVTMIGTVLLVIITTLLSYVYYITTKDFDYWKKRNIPYIKPLPFVGNYGTYILLKEFFGGAAQTLCRQIPHAPYTGVFYGRSPTLLVQDPDVIKLIMTKDFDHFHSRENGNYSHKESFLRSIFFAKGDTWKVVKQNMIPIFSSSEQKISFDHLKSSINSFEKTLDQEISNGTVEIKSLLVRYVLDTTGNCLFGIDTKALEKDWKNNTLFHIANNMFTTTKGRGFKNVFRNVYPEVFYALGLKNFPTQFDSYLRKYLKDLFKECNSIKDRSFNILLRKMVLEKTLVGDTLENRNKTKTKLDLDDNLILAECVAMLGGGFESSATTLGYTLYEIAKHPEVQEQLFQEIDDYLKRHDNKLMYDCLSDLTFADACLNEAMRLYPIISVLRREVTETYTLPCGAVLDKGVRIHIPAYHLHRDPKLFPNPEEFQPERFMGANKQNINPYSYLAFGRGPRMCIGMRFSQMQMVTGLVTILKKYRLELPADMPRKLEFTPTAFLTQPKRKITLKFQEREGWQLRKYA